MRYVVLDTETTGLDPAGHRITEIACIKLINRQETGEYFQTYVNPERELDPGAAQVTGLTYEFLKDKPLFHEVVDEFYRFIDGATLIIHNAPFDIGFLNAEFRRMDFRVQDITEHCEIIDTLALARKMYPGQKNNLDALCRRLKIDRSDRTYHGALIDTRILAKVYLAMTAGQTVLDLSTAAHHHEMDAGGRWTPPQERRIPIMLAKPHELVAHQARLKQIQARSQGQCLWQQLEESLIP